MKYIDSHCHLNFATYQEDITEVVQRTEDASVAVVNIGTQQNTSVRAVELAEQYPHFWAIVGLHPIHTVKSFHDEDEIGGEGSFNSRAEVFDTDYYNNLIKSSSKVIGIGECGFDYYHNDEETKEAQEKAFRGQVELALRHNLPLMLHIRPSEGTYDAYYDTLEILKKYKEKNPELRGQAHFFAGDVDIAQSFIDLGFYISFTGVITFTSDYNEVIESVPLDRILSETDAPYVTPVPFRGKRNEPIHVREVVVTLAERKGCTLDEMSTQIKENVQKLYGISF